MGNRYFNTGEPVTPQSFLAEEFRKADSIIEAQIRDKTAEIIAREKKACGLDKLMDKVQEAWKEFYGTSLELSYRSEPLEITTVGEKLKNELKPLRDKQVKMQEAWREASLRVSLGKNPDDKIRELKNFSATLYLILEEKSPEPKRTGVVRRV